MRRFLRRAALGLLIFLGASALLLVALYLEEDWRGVRAWTACQEQLKARGEVLDLRTFYSNQKPENDLNKVPIFAEAYQPPEPLDDTQLLVGRPPLHHLPRLDRIDPLLGSHRDNQFPRSGNYVRSQALDLKPWQAFYRSLPQAHLSGTAGTSAQDVLLALSQFDPELKEVSTALSNPQA